MMMSGVIALIHEQLDMRRRGPETAIRKCPCWCRRFDLP